MSTEGTKAPDEEDAVGSTAASFPAAAICPGLTSTKVSMRPETSPADCPTGLIVVTAGKVSAHRSRGTAFKVGPSRFPGTAGI